MKPLSFAEMQVIVKARAQLNVGNVIELLQDSLTKAWSKQARAVLLELLSQFQARGLDERVKAEDLAAVERRLKTAFGSGLQELARRPVMQAMTDVYGGGKRAVSVGLSLNQADAAALDLLEDYNLFWVRNYYDNFVSDRIHSSLKSYFQQGLTRAQLAENLQRELGQSLKHETAAYFATLADHTSNKVHNMGRLAGFEDAGVQYAKVVANLDGRTTDICRRMHGRLIPLKALTKQRDQALRAIANQDYDGVKASQPMITEEVWSGKLGSLLSTKELIGAGLGGPPYHFRCRTTLVAYFSPRNVGIQNKLGYKVAAADKERLRAMTDFELREWLDEVKNKASDGKLQWSPSHLKGDIRKFALVKHAQEMGMTPEQYKAAAVEAAANAKERVLRIYRGKLPQLSLSDGKNIVIVDEGNLIRGFYRRESDRQWNEAQAGFGRTL